MRRALITTTINVPHNLVNWRDAGLHLNDVVIVAGDTNTPEDKVRALLNRMPGENIYLSPSDQAVHALSDVVGWRTIQRRNLALLEAMRHEPDYIITVDDDNFPVDDDFFARLDDLFTLGETTEWEASDTLSLSSGSGWWNAGDALLPPVVVRGFPLSEIHANPRTSTSHPVPHHLRVGVMASLWLGEPDIDAAQRIVNAPTVTGMAQSNNVLLTRGTWCPFNTQSTAFRAELAPAMMMWPGVGRYDDIWASFVTQRVMYHTDMRVMFGHPLVRQDRNPHNLVTDLRAELLGMEYTEEVVDVLLGVDTAGLDIINAVEKCYMALDQLRWLPRQTQDAFPAWLSDVRKVTR